MTNTINRRHFCSTVAGLAGTAVVGVLNSPAHAVAKEFPPGRFVDVHVHIGGIRKGATRPLLVEDLLKWMDLNDVAQACVLPLVSPESFPNPVSTEYVLEHTQPHRDRLIPFCSIDPRNTWYSSGQALIGQLERYKEKGARGFGEHKPGVEITDKRNLAIFAGCQSTELPVLIHLDSRRNVDVPGLPGLQSVLKMFPQAVFIGHATGFWNSISGGPNVSLSGYQKGKVEPGGALDRLMDEFPNLYGDLSAFSAYNAVSRDPDFGREFLIRRADRMLFGTDFLTPDQEIPQLDFYRRLDLPADVRQKIFRDNIRRILKLTAE